MALSVYFLSMSLNFPLVSFVPLFYQNMFNFRLFAKTCKLHVNAFYPAVDAYWFLCIKDRESQVVELEMTRRSSMWLGGNLSSGHYP